MINHPVQGAIAELSLAAIQQRAGDIFANADWREGQNIASGLTLSTKEMFNRALEQAENEILYGDN